MSSRSKDRVVHFEAAGAIGRVRLMRPEKRNAINDELILQLKECFETLPESVKAVVLSGEGEHFSAGLDLSSLRERDMTHALHHSRMWHDAFEKVQFGKVPVVALLHGAVVGGGLELACSAHIRVAEESAFYALPEGQRGLFVGGSGSVRIPRLIGFSRMTDMMLTGRVLDAAEGQQIGLSHYLAKPGEGLALATELAERIAGNAALTNFAVMHALPRIAEQSMTGGLLMESMMAAIASSDEDAQRRMRDFLEKKAAKVGRGK